MILLSVLKSAMSKNIDLIIKARGKLKEQADNEGEEGEQQ